MMSEIILYFCLFNQKEFHQVRMDDNYLIKPFLEDIRKCWKYTPIQEAILYSMDQKGRLNTNKTWNENGVMSGDHIILI